MTLTEQRIARTGTEITFAAASALGDSFVNQGYQRVRFKNTTGSPISVTVDTPNPDNYGVVNDILDVTITVPANKEISAGPFDQGRHNDQNGKTQLTYSTNVGLSVAVTS